MVMIMVMMIDMTGKRDENVVQKRLLVVSQQRNQEPSLVCAFAFIERKKTGKVVTSLTSFLSSVNEVLLDVRGEEGRKGGREGEIERAGGVGGGKIREAGPEGGNLPRIQLF